MGKPKPITIGDLKSWALRCGASHLFEFAQAFSDAAFTIGEFEARAVPEGYEARVQKPSCPDCKPLPGVAYLSPLAAGTRPWRAEHPHLSGRTETGDMHRWFASCAEVFAAIRAAEEGDHADA